MPEACAAAPTVVTVAVEVYNVWESHLRAVGVAAIAGIDAYIMLHLCLRSSIVFVVRVVEAEAG